MSTDTSSPATSPATVTAATLSATLGIAAASWIAAVRQMAGMDMGTGTRLGSFGSFGVLWTLMMAAMMLPGAVPAVSRHVHSSGRMRALPLFVASYIAVWALVGVVVYALYRPHGPVLAGVVAIVVGGYEFTPVKRYSRRRCREGVRSGFEYGLCCVGSSIGLMALYVALGVMSVTWMLVITGVVAAQKLLPSKAAVDVAVGLAIAGLGLWIVLAPSSAPGLAW